MPAATGAGLLCALKSGCVCVSQSSQVHAGRHTEQFCGGLAAPLRKSSLPACCRLLLELLRLCVEKVLHSTAAGDV